ncbi:MAG: oligoendopeptidase F [Bacteroidales bacterium]|jgi:oligoendopeptidase F|nr:oligoendopeptidase F [Bacteroidales bacterium]
MMMKKITFLVVALLAVNFSGFGQQELTPDHKDYYQYNWRLTDVYADWDAWQQDLEYVQSQIPRYLDYKGRLGESAATLLEFRKFGDEIARISSRLYIYVMLNQDVDGKNPIYKTRFQQLQTMSIERSRNSTWIQPEMAKIPQATINQWVKENEELAVYEHLFDSFYRQLEHIPDEETQQILTYYRRALGAPSNAYGSLSKADMEYHQVTLSDGEEITTSPAMAAKVYNNNPNQADRIAVTQARVDVFAKNKNTYADLWLGIAQNRWASAQIQGYESCLQSVLQPNNIPLDVYKNLIEVASSNTDALQKYRELRKKALQLDEYYSSDESFPLVDFEKEYAWEEAVGLVHDCLKPMGKEYNELLHTATQEGWIDVYEKPGKQTGAYNMPLYDVHPYILMNWAGTRNNVYTLAHELGHAIHGMLSSKYQPFVYGRSASMVAEVASIFNEHMLLDHMIQNAQDPNEKVALLVQAIDMISGKFYRQSQFAEFEYTLYTKVENNEPLNAEIIGDLYDQISEKYNGEVMQSVENGQYSWPRVFHFFDLYYYVYNYAVSYSASSSLFNQIAQAGNRKEAKLAREKYLNLLKSGSNDYPVALLKDAGVDLTTKAPFVAVVNRMNELVNQLEVALQEAGKI